MDGDGLRRAVGPSTLGSGLLPSGHRTHCLGTVYGRLVQALRDAQQSVHASALQVCYCARGEGAVLGVPLASRKGSHLIERDGTQPLFLLTVFFALTTSICHDSSTILSRNIMIVCIFIFYKQKTHRTSGCVSKHNDLSCIHI